MAPIGFHAGAAARRAARRGTRLRGRSAQSSSDRSSRLILVHSEGAVFDSARAAHEACLAPAFERWFCGGAGVGRAARLWLSVALESRLRGCGRYRLLSAALRLAARDPELRSVVKREQRLAAALGAWLAAETSPSPERLESALQAGCADPCLYKALEWYWSVDAELAALPPPAVYPGAAAALPIAASACGLVALCSEPTRSAREAWDLAGLGDFPDGFARVLRGRAASLESAVEACGNPRSLLLIGDSALDLEAAKALGAAFYPIFRDRVDACWDEFAASILPRFREGESLRPPIAEFLASFTGAAPR